MATPDSIQLKIMRVEEAISWIQTTEEAGQALLLVRSPKEALSFIDAGFRDHVINVGNLNMKKGKTKVLGNLWVFPEDVELIKDIYGKGVKMEVRAVTNKKSQDVMELLKKSKLV